MCPAHVLLVLKPSLWKLLARVWQQLPMADVHGNTCSLKHTVAAPGGESSSREGVAGVQEVGKLR